MQKVTILLQGLIKYPVDDFKLLQTQIIKTLRKLHATPDTACEPVHNRSSFTLGFYLLAVPQKLRWKPKHVKETLCLMSRNGSNVPGISRNSGTADHCKYRKSNGYDGQQVKEILQESNDCLAVPIDEEKHEEFKGRGTLSQESLPTKAMGCLCRYLKHILNYITYVQKGPGRCIPIKFASCN